MINAGERLANKPWVFTVSKMFCQFIYARVNQRHV